MEAPSSGSARKWDPKWKLYRDSDSVLADLTANFGKDRLKSSIDDIAERRKLLNAQKRKLSQDLKNERRKRTRLLEKGAKFSIQDIIDVASIRMAKYDKMNKALVASFKPGAGPPDAPPAEVPPGDPPASEEEAG